MKKIFSFLCILSLACFADVKELSVLTIGNSFAESVFEHLPAIANANPDCKLILQRANIGGCSLERHWKTITTDDQTGSKGYQNKTKSLKEILSSRKWDVVTLQQVSHESYKPDTFEPYLGNLIEYVRQYAPSAKIVLQMTWAYRTDSTLYKGTFDQKAMYDGIISAYQKYSAKYNFPVIPSGIAVQLARQNIPVPFQNPDPEAVKALKRPELPVQTGSLCAGYVWHTIKPKAPEQGEAKIVLRCDPNHLNRDGRYLQACTWFGFLFGTNPEDITFLPKGITPENAAIYRKCARLALEQGRQIFPVK